jgi:hypothetical protein
MIFGLALSDHIKRLLLYIEFAVGSLKQGFSACGARTKTIVILILDFTFASCFVAFTILHDNQKKITLLYREVKRLESVAEIIRLVKSNTVGSRYSRY